MSFVLLCPQVDDLQKTGEVDITEAEVMSWGEAHDPADPARSLYGQQGMRSRDPVLGIVGQCGEIVGENMRLRVGGVALATRPDITWAEVAFRVIRQPIAMRLWLLLAVPGTLRSVRGDQHPLAIERVVAPVSTA